MSYLLDTHTFLWFINDDMELSTAAKALIETTNQKVYLSIGSIWEMAIKVALGKLTLPTPFTNFVTTQLRANNFILLQIRVEHTGLVATLPHHHGDPFDRLIIAQAKYENLSIIGKDKIFDEYGVTRIW